MDKKSKKDKKKERKEKHRSEDHDFAFQPQRQEEEDIRQKTKYYNVKLDQNPHDISLWLEFIAFQDKAMQFSATSKKSESTKTSINEVKLSIFDKALQLNPKNSWLLAEYLKCCEQVYDVPKLLTKWDQILNENPGDIILWMQYIDFRQTNLVSFNVTQCLQVFEDCLHVLRKSALVATDHNDKLRIERIMIHVFQRACVFILQSGYSERAYACWQAMIELVFFAPDHLRQQTFYDRVAALEIFWESEWPRFGEDDAKGWAYYAEQDDNEMKITPTPPNPINVSNFHGKDVYEKWAKAEEIYNDQLLSTRTGMGGDDDINVNDPYRIIIFDDIRTFLFDVTFSQSYIELLYACFSFVGLTFNPGYSSSNPLITDMFLNTKLANESIANNSFWQTRPEDNDLFKFPIKSFPQVEDNLFKSLSWFCICDEVDVINVDMKFARNAFYQLRQVANDTGIKLCRLAVEHLFDTSSGRSLAKSMLKREKMNLALWNGYAQIERSSNKYTEARKVYLGAIAQIRSYPEQFQINAPLLHRMFAEMELEQGHHKTAMNVLLLLTEEQGNIESIAEVDVSATRLLKARKYYAQQMAKSTTTISQYESGNSLHYCVCYALLECLSQNLQQASKIFEEMIQDIEMRKGYLDLEAELIFMAYVKLIYQYSNNFDNSSDSASSNDLLQDVLVRAIKAFPNNTIFLSMYFHQEIRGRISVGLNSILEENLKKNPSHILWTFILHSELCRQPFNVKRIRSLFDRALECSKTKSSISLWTLYIKFEMTYGRHDIAKSLYYRAVRECPWSKDLYMMAFRKLRSLFTIDELEEAINVLYEKEIRLRVSIDDFDDKRQEGNEMNE